MALRILVGMRQPNIIRTNIRPFTEAALSDFAQGILAHKVHAGKTVKVWKLMSFIVVFPAIAFGIYNAVQLETEHKSHPRQEFEGYKHLRVRAKPFPWGDGNHTLFHNSHFNALPDGYEDL